jgi:glycerophosphoryl diester phosphodiesterase
MAAVFLHIQGHRGARGLLPENSIPAFLKGLHLGVSTLEMDVVITRDHQVLVSHEPYLSGEICLFADGTPISQQQEQQQNIYQLTYEQVCEFDCGSKPHPRFPEQENFPVHKPLLSEVIEAVEYERTQKKLPPVHYNIEIKSTPEGDNIQHPAPESFVNLVLAVLQEKEILDRSNLQSFDVRPLQVCRNLLPDLPLALLVENQESPAENLSRLGFIPPIYSPDYRLVDENLVAFTRQHQMLLIPWTVNDPADIIRMIRMGAQGIISDFPDRVLQIVRQNPR